MHEHSQYIVLKHNRVHIGELMFQLSVRTRRAFEIHDFSTSFYEILLGV